MGEDLISCWETFNIWLCKNLIFHEKILYLMRKDLIFDCVEKDFIFGWEILNILWEKI